MIGAMRASALHQAKVKVTAISLRHRNMPRQAQSRETCDRHVRQIDRIIIQTRRPPHPGDGSAMPAS